jgi:hypothetical protein
MAIVPFRASAERWRAAFRTLGPDLPIDFLIAWLDKESGGNPCSTGIPGVEAGIFQTFHPADDRFGATFAQLRQGCSGQTVVDPSQVDFDLQARHGINFVRSKAATAQAHLSAAGVSWSRSSSDFWKGVKMEHALPCVMGDLLPRVARKFGPPRDWDTFKRQALSLDPSEMGTGCANFARSPSVRGLRNRLEDTMFNAEEVGKFGGGVLGAVGKLGILGPILLLGVAATFYAVYVRRQDV